MNSREVVLQRLAQALDRPVGGERPKSVDQRLQQRPLSTQPGQGGDLVEQLIANMEGVQMTVTELQTSSDVMAALDGYLDDNDIVGEITLAPALADLAWERSRHHDSMRVGAANGVEATSVTACLAAVAETGSVVMASGAQHPISLNFLPDNHVVVLFRHQVVRYLEDVWPLLEARDTGTLGADAEKVPRAVNFVTGPSRTADIEQTLEIGAHGPRRLHVLLVASEE